MANIVITELRVAPINVIEQATKPAAAAVLAGQWVTEDADGNWRLALATTAPNAGDRRAMATQSSHFVGDAVTAVYKGKLDIGDGLGGLAYDAPVYLSDTAGATADAAGTVSVVVGVVSSSHMSLAPYNKHLLIDN